MFSLTHSLFSPFLALFLNIFLANAIAPPNEYLAGSAWSIAQHDNYAQASSPLEGPTSAAGVDYLFGTDVAGPLTMLYTEDGKVVWGSSFTSVFKVDRSQNKLRLIDALEKPEMLRRTDTFRGIYNILTKEGVFYISSSNVIAAYADAVRGDSLSGIVSIGSYDFSPLARKKERVLALNLSYDGKIIFLTNKGGVGVISRILDKIIDLKYCTDHEVSVTNSMSIDENGGIYVVTSRHLHRLWWDSATNTLHNVVPPADASSGPIFPCGNNSSNCQVWSTIYPVSEDPIVGRPTKEGSGTTPSLLKTQNKLYVMIADGKIAQEVLAVDTEDGTIVASHLVSFNNKPDTESYTEQSILVSGERFLVTQNALTEPATRMNSFLELINAERIISGRGLPEAVEENVYLLPVVLGDSPRGYQQFQLDDSVYPPTITTTWTRNDVGCPNAIPTMSEATGVMYCVGKRSRGFGNYLRLGFSGIWTIEALDWLDGTTVFRADTGFNVLYNSLYAATQIGPDQEIIYGSIGGIVRLRSADPPVQQSQTINAETPSVMSIPSVQSIQQTLANPEAALDMSFVSTLLDTIRV